MTQYAILINYEPVPAKGREIEAQLGTVASDWLRFGIGQYLVVTDHTAETIYSAIKAVLGENDYVLVVAADFDNRHGWGSKVAADWMKKYSP